MIYMLRRTLQNASIKVESDWRINYTKGGCGLLSLVVFPWNTHSKC